MSENGYLCAFIGGMFSGKSTMLIGEITRYADISIYSGHKKPLLINSKIDNRDLKNLISSHNSGYKGISDHIDVMSVDKLSDVDFSNHDVIGIDEAQFFIDLEKVVNSLLKIGKKIFLAGLVGDSDQNHFGQIYKLLPKMNHIQFCHSVCHDCLREHLKAGKILTPEVLSTMKGSFTKKIQKCNNSQIDVGASDKYLPSCGPHLLTNKDVCD
jgi:thymidine kinase